MQGYPTVKSGVSTLQSYPLGQKSVETVKSYYDGFLVPFLKNFAGPYSYVAPYVLKADDLADSGLDKVDNRLPIITKEPQAIKESVLDFAYTPVRFASDGKNYLLNTYGQEYKKCGGDDAGPLISGTKAAVTSSIVITSDILLKLSEFFTAKKDEGKQFASAKYQQGSQAAANGINYVNGKKDEAINYASDTAEKARNLAYAKADEAKIEAEKLSKDAKKKAGN